MAALQNPCILHMGLWNPGRDRSVSRIALREMTHGDCGSFSSFVDIVLGSEVNVVVGGSALSALSTFLAVHRAHGDDYLSYGGSVPQANCPSRTPTPQIVLVGSLTCAS